ncbi:MAG: TIGR02186 family protein [Hyphomicrobiales bacterium]|nr:TIGR02186 family protein [Hyphomicrobiales bacterium]MDE2374217.1 TIGR02186 family protein [Hyphomicrobiales bacterium]
MRRALAAALPLAGLLAGAGPAAAAERLIAALSEHRVLITSSYTGVQLMLFGSVERDAGSQLRKGPYDIVATVTGPHETLRARSKSRVLGIWMNTQARTFVDVPAYLAVLATAPLDVITSAENQRHLQVGLTHTPLPELIHNDVGVVANDPFQGELIRLMRERGLYSQEPHAVTFLTPTLFRAAIKLPADVPTGHYRVDVKLFAEGNLLARTDSTFDIVKVGFEQFVVNAAHQYGLLYGIATALMALLTGWIASVTFRRD